MFLKVSLKYLKRFENITVKTLNIECYDQR